MFMAFRLADQGIYIFAYFVNTTQLIRHGNQFSKIINSEMVILTPITINNHFNNANYVTKVDHLCSERHTFNFLLKKVDFRDGIPGQQHLLF